MKRPPAVCGTDGGYYAHRRKAHDAPCAACLLAHAAAERARTARVRAQSK